MKKPIAFACALLIATSLLSNAAYAQRSAVIQPDPLTTDPIITDPIISDPIVTDPILSRSVKPVADAIDGEYIVVLKNHKTTSTVSQRAALLAQTYGLQLGPIYQQLLRGFAVTNATASTANLLANDAEVAYVIQNAPVAANAVQTNAPWNLDRLDQILLPHDTRYEYLQTGQGVHAYILDSGIRTTHQEFAGRASFAADFVNDGFGDTDCNGHGTHIAGIIGGQTYGVAKQVQLHSVRMLNCAAQGSVVKALAALDWVASHAQRPAVVNLSFTAQPHETLDRAAESLSEMGIAVVASAGHVSPNAYTEAVRTYSPARVNKVIAVSATDRNDLRAGFANTGTYVDMFAPGVDIVSAAHTGDTATSMQSGTSQAAAHVTGLVAQYLENNPTANVADVTARLMAQTRVGVVDQPYYWIIYSYGWVIGNVPVYAPNRLAGSSYIDYLPMFRFMNADANDRHYYPTQRYLDLVQRNFQFVQPWVFEGATGYLGKTQTANNTALHYYWHRSNGNHFYTIDWSELGAGTADYEYKGIVGYCASSAGPNTQNLYRYYHTRNSLHFYTVDPNELGAGRNNWMLEGVACQTYKQPN